MPKWEVTYYATVAVEADDAVTAESKLKSILPTTTMLQRIGKIIRTHWAVEVVEVPEEKPRDKVEFPGVHARG